uniref:non-specific serine/threonine protein kinase n=1 Tax=Ditylenchus dipsaci TaxID=166011 RepID=A0A915D6N9_9BILA
MYKTSSDNKKSMVWPQAQKYDVHPHSHKHASPVLVRAAHAFFQSNKKPVCQGKRLLISLFVVPSEPSGPQPAAAAGRTRRQNNWKVVVRHKHSAENSKRKSNKNMSLPILAKKVKKLASMHILSLKLMLNGRGFSKFKNQYRLKGEMGQGGFGVVYRAIRIADDLPVAVKFIERKHLNDERVPMEICMLARCAKISGVIKLIDWFNMPEGFLIIMERPTPCIDLFDFIHNQQLLDEDLSRFLFRQIVQTTWDCAERKVLHRDLKDENVVIDLVTGETKIIDFGAATLLKKTRYHDFQGTRLYCPPEWFLHSLFLGREATIWSLGILLYNMVNGRLPFHNEKDICTAHLLGPLPFFASLSSEVKDLIEKSSMENMPVREWLELSPSTSLSPLSYSSNSEDEEEEHRFFMHHQQQQSKSRESAIQQPHHQRPPKSNNGEWTVDSQNHSNGIAAREMLNAEQEGAAVQARITTKSTLAGVRNGQWWGSEVDEDSLSSDYFHGERRLEECSCRVLLCKSMLTCLRSQTPQWATILISKPSAPSNYTSNNPSELFSKSSSKYSLATPSFRPGLRFNLKHAGNSFDSGTSSALQSPRNVAFAPYVF